MKAGKSSKNSLAEKSLQMDQRFIKCRTFGKSMETRPRVLEEEGNIE